MNVASIQPDWPAPSNVHVLSTLREGGASQGAYRSLNLADHVGDAIEDVIENRRRLRLACQLPAEPSWLKQVHGVAVADLDAAPLPPAADAAFTRRSGVVCAILTADCLPVVLTDRAGSWVAAAHAGWRGLAAGVLEAVVASFHAQPSQLLAWMGPGIGAAAFEVGAEVREAFVRTDPRAQAAFVPNDRSRFRADLGMLARLRLQSAGVNRIFGGSECTHSHAERFFSYRRDGQSGRQATLIWKT